MSDWESVLDFLTPKPPLYCPEAPSLTQRVFMRTNAVEALFGGQAGGGKEQPASTTIYTPWGPKRFGDIKVGDQVSNPDGSIARVVRVWERGTKDVFRVTFIDGASTLVGAEHLWQVNRSGTNSSAPKVMTTEQMKATLDVATAAQERGARAHWPLIPITAPVVFTINDNRWGNRWPVDPYVLGLLLGDGHLGHGGVSLTTADSEMVLAFTRWCEGVGGGARVDTKADNAAVAVHLCGPGAAIETLRKLGLYETRSATKFIPEAYKISPLDVRWAIVQGLMDTDGYVDKRGHCSYVSISETLADDLRWILMSLGFKVTKTSKIPTYTHDEEKREGQRAYTLTIVGDQTEGLFRLTRKRERCRPGINGGDEAKRRVISIEPEGQAECRCITVDNPNGLYLTDDFIVTHNSSAVLMAASQYFDVPGYSAIIFRRTFQDLNLPGALMDRARLWYGPHDDVHWNGNSNTFTFPSGARLTFGYMNNREDYLRYKSSEFQFCVRSDTLIAMADGSYKEISAITEGELVETLEGPRRVRRVWRVGNKPSVTITTPAASVVCSMDHQILTSASSWVSPRQLAATQPPQGSSIDAASTATLQALLPPSLGSRPGPQPWPARVLEDRPGDGLLGTDASPATLGIGSVASGGGRRAARQPEGSFVRVALHGPVARSAALADPVETRRHGAGHGLGWTPEGSDSSGRCSSCGDRHGGLPPAGSATGPGGTPSQGDAGERSQSCPLPGDPGSTPGYTPTDGSLYVHPYTMEVRASSADVLHAQAYIAPAGEQDLWDMQIEQANHYISYGGIVHRNCGFDEVTEIREESYRYLFSRLRKPGLGPLSEVPLRMRCASNPAPNWVRQRFIVEGTDKGRVFVPSGLEDNPGIDVVGYRRMLSELDLVERQRLEFGDWWATQLGSMFAREDFTTIDPGELPHLVTTGRLVRFWDLAATEPSATNPDPDWTVGTLMLFTEGKTFILDVQRIRKNSDKVEALIRDTATEDGKSVAIRFEREPGSAGKALADQYARYVLPGFDFAAIPATGDKETRARPFASAVANGNVYLVRGKWNTEWLDEVTAFPVPNVHDDQVDSAVGAYIFLTGLGGEPRKRATLIA